MEPEETTTGSEDRKGRKIDPLVEDVVRDQPLEEENKEEDTTEIQPEGRFFLKDKLCALGLGDVSTPSTEGEGGMAKSSLGLPTRPKISANHDTKR